jgi:hypothetical protein
MNKFFRTCCLIAAVLTSGTVLATPTLSLIPQSPHIHPLENLFVDVVVSGLQSGGTHALLGAFDLTVTYDPGIVQLILPTSNLGGGLGDPSDTSQTFISGDNSTPGIFRFLEVSLLEASASSCFFCTGPYLEELQGDSFTLARLMFYMPSTAPGAESIAFMFPIGSADLSDADGNQIANVLTNNASVAIPEPSTVLLVLAALVLIWFVSFTSRPKASRSIQGQRWFGVTALVVLSSAMPTHAAVFDVAAGDSYGLIQAIALSNTTPEADTINLAAGTYTLTSPVEASFINGANGLPKVSGQLLINGNGAVIEREVTAPAFRFFQIDGPGKLTLHQVVLKNARSSDPGDLDKLGAVFNQGELNLSNCVIQDSVGVGLVNLNSGKVTITACSFFNNLGRGGALLNESGTVAIVRSKIYANRTQGDGGGILNRSVLTIEESQINGNEAASNGGGLANGSNGVTTVVNSTFSGNRAAGNLGDGGGILNYSSLKLINVTVAGNSAGRFGGGVWNYAPFTGQHATLNLINTLLADNYGSVAIYGDGVAKDDCSNNNEIILGTHSLIENGGCSALAKGFLTGDAALGALADNGGPTLTHRLTPGSKAIDAGSPVDCPATDQRGTARPQDGDGNGIAACDIGAYEAGPVANTADLNQDGCIDNTDMGLLMAALVSTSPKPASYDLNGDGRVNVADARKLATLFSRPGGQSCQ